MKKYFVCIGRTSTNNLFVTQCTGSYEDATLMTEYLRSAEQKLKISLEPTYGQNITIIYTIEVENEKEGEKWRQNIRDMLSEVFFYFGIPL